MGRCKCVTIASKRESFAFGCTPHYIQVWHASDRGPWYRGVLLGVDGFLADVQLHGVDKPTQLGTLWPDRLARVAMGRVRRDQLGRPRIRWNKASGLLQLMETRGRQYPTFSVVDVDAFPEMIEEWLRKPATCKHRELRRAQFSEVTGHDLRPNSGI